MDQEVYIKGLEGESLGHSDAHWRPARRVMSALLVSPVGSAFRSASFRFANNYALGKAVDLFLLYIPIPVSCRRSALNEASLRVRA
jgi:hypothetical protein